VIRTEREKVYLVKKGGKQLLVELHRDASGRLFVVPMYATKHVYEKGEDVREWSYDLSKAEEIDYMSLPRNVREALSKLQIF